MELLHLSEYLLKTIADRRQRITEALADGSAKSFDEYQHLVGQIRGVTYVEDEIKAAIKGIELSDD
jgi:hypothetical protein